MRDTSLYVKDILDAIESIEKFTVGMEYEAFLDDDKSLSAVIRKLEMNPVSRSKQKQKRPDLSIRPFLLSEI